MIFRCAVAGVSFSSPKHAAQQCWKTSRDEVMNNKVAALPQSLPYLPLDRRVTTISVDPKWHTMAALYGNDAAMHAIRARSDGSRDSTLAPPGSVLALATWVQREDPHWFGGWIPDTPKSVEFVEVDATGKRSAYRCFDGPGLSEHRVPADVAEKQTKLSQPSLRRDCPDVRVRIPFLSGLAEESQVKTSVVEVANGPFEVQDTSSLLSILCPNRLPP